ncbi:IDEAL domain-containing protein [Brevibacillus sp. SYSU BS000544]|uniref:IDEAL domain-containing protein n=1 Tax=Brevibacillus sp. SYSU BS000544 TaxID=3416443 RepID=UPI003CE4D4DA
MDRPNFFTQNMVAGLLSEIVIDEQVRKFRKRTLYELIDEALAVGNKEQFYVLTSELREILAFEKETG